MEQVGFIGYAVAAGAFLVLAALLAVGWEGRFRGLRLVLAAALTAIWCAALAWFAWSRALPSGLLFTGETLTTAAWLAVLSSLSGSGGFPRRLARLAHLAWAALLVAGIFAIATAAPWAGELVMTGGLGLGLLGLVLLEQLYRNSNTSGRWALRYLYFGLGGLFVYDVFMYSQGLLLDGISASVWDARGFVMTLTVPLIAIAARRNPEWSLRVFVSREIAFYATSVAAVGVYLLLMAFGGYLVQLLGGRWGTVAQIVFFAAALGLLGILVASAAIRRRLRVFLVKHFYRHKYDYREEWLRFIETLSGSTGETPQVAAVRAIAQIIGSPRAVLLTAGDRPGQWAVDTAWPGGELLPDAGGPLTSDAALHAFLERRQWVVDVPEWELEPELYEGVTLPPWLTQGRHWRLAVPVLLGRRLIGMLLLAEPPAGLQLTFEDRDLLKTTARHVATHLAQHASEQRLAEERQFAAFSKLASFMMHDLKNASAQLELVVANAERHKNNPEFVEDAMATVASAVRRISQLIAQLQRGNEATGSERFDLQSALADAVARCGVRQPHPVLASGGDRLPVEADRERLASVVEHLIRNAQEAARPAGQVEVRAAAHEGRAVVEIRDDGPGMTPEFVRERLFRPFDSTKGSKGMGIGAYQAREYVRSVGGWLEIESRPGQGTLLRIVLPLATPEAAAAPGAA
ncbi:MAG TPA: XrtA/PEP-CTERM system histidine kinase PrsK [Steroidobacteraceae bacterium]|nr:XrtA/PEP-CTERM system histidine kinase PrsK [Steroidobacteraceae bacterium]